MKKKKPPGLLPEDQLQEIRELIQSALGPIPKKPDSDSLRPGWKDGRFSPTPQPPLPASFYLDDLAHPSERTEEEIITENAEFLMPFFEVKDVQELLSSNHQPRPMGVVGDSPLEEGISHGRKL